MKQATLAGIIGVVILGCIAVIGSAFYTVVLPKLQEPPAPPKPKPPTVALYPTLPTIKTSIPQVAALPNTTIVQMAHQTANVHQAWGLANMGKMTDPGSLFARYGLTVRFFRHEAVEDRIRALVEMATAFNSGDIFDLLDNDNPSAFSGVHFFTVGGDASSWVIGQTNRALQRINPAFEAEIIGFAGLSAGENQFLGPREWRDEPREALGGVVVGVPYESAWGVLALWCAQNDLPLNADQEFYNPKALNFVQAETPDEAAQMYIEDETIERIFLANGRDARGRSVQAGEKRRTAIQGVVTQTPLDQQIAAEQNGLVTIASTRHYPNQTPQFIVGLKQWNIENHATVSRMLAALFEASAQIESSDRSLKADRIAPKSEADIRWQAARYAHELFDAASPDDWYGYYHTAKTQVERSSDSEVDIGGASVADLQQNLLFFGLGGSGPDRGEVVYSRFAQLAKQYDFDLVEDYPEWQTVFNDAYLKSVLEGFPELAKADSEQPRFVVEIKKEPPPEPPEPPKPTPNRTAYNIFFEIGQNRFTAQREVVLQQAADQIALFGKAKVEIHGYSDSFGSAEFNRELSQRRAEAVHAWLKNVIGTEFLDDVKVVAHGEEDLLVEDYVQGEYVPERMAQNRRVVLKIIPL